MTKLADLKKQWMKDPDFTEEYENLAPEFNLASTLIRARAAANLTQEDVAKRMGTSQSAIARLESGHRPSLQSLRRYAAAVGHKVEIRLTAD